MAVLKVKLTDGSWADITGTGATGPSGGPVPTGGTPGQVIVKSGVNDGEVAWATSPRLAFNALVGSVPSHSTANTMGNLVSGNVTIDPAKMYHIFASVRAIQDPGAVLGFAQFKMTVGIQLEGYDCVSGPDSGLWGAWSQNWMKSGSALSSTLASVPVALDLLLNAAAKTVYAPRVYIIEYPV